MKKGLFLIGMISVLGMGRVPTPTSYPTPHPSGCPSPSPVPEECIQALIREKIKPVYESNLSSAAKCMEIRRILEQLMDPLLASTEFSLLTVLRINCSSCTIFDQKDDCPWEILGPSGPDVFIFEAEQGLLTAPFVVGFDTLASSGSFISTSVSGSGMADYSFLATSTGPYVLWGRILSSDAGRDSFSVSIDTGTVDIYDTAENTWGPNWQWTKAGGRNGTGIANAIFPRQFSVSLGTHTLHIQGRESGTELDQLIFTDDLLFVPK